MTPLYIFDLDGTLSLAEHRRHFLDNKKDPHRWDAFYASCGLDTPNEAVIRVAVLLAAAGNDIWIFSGRRESERETTLKWFDKYSPTLAYVARNFCLQMRPTGDTTPDDVLKQSWLDAMLPEDRSRLAATFDDRDRVVAMWRRNGITCFQVAPGDF